MLKKLFSRISRLKEARLAQSDWAAKYLPQILGFLFLAGFVVFAWQEPSQLPPGGNVDSPINVGTSTQYKAGALGIGGVFQAFSDAVFNGQIKITGGSPGTGKVFTSDASGLASWMAIARGGVPNVQVFDSPGTYWFTASEGVTKVMVEVWGGGGGGGASSCQSWCAGGGGGGGGGAGKSVITVSAGTQYKVVVGAGGAGGSWDSGSSGEASSFADLIFAYGGAGGTEGISGGAAGGGGTSNALFNQRGSVGQNGIPCGSVATGGKGGDAGAVGSMPGGGAGGLPSGSCPGGCGLNITATPCGFSGRNGVFPGGGAGGGGSYGLISNPGGNGASGRVIVYW